MRWSDELIIRRGSRGLPEPSVDPTRWWRMHPFIGGAPIATAPTSLMRSRKSSLPSSATPGEPLERVIVVGDEAVEGGGCVVPGTRLARHRVLTVRLWLSRHRHETNGNSPALYHALCSLLDDQYLLVGRAHLNNHVPPGALDTEARDDGCSATASAATGQHPFIGGVAPIATRLTPCWSSGWILVRYSAAIIAEVRADCRRVNVSSGQSLLRRPGNPGRATPASD